MPQHTDGQISVILWGYHVSTTLSNPSCELASLIVGFHKRWITDRETLRSTATQRKVHPSWIKVTALVTWTLLRCLMGCTGLHTTCSNDHSSLCTSQWLTYTSIFTLFWGVAWQFKALQVEYNFNLTYPEELRSQGMLDDH
jgi:hypothetical protein